MRFYYTLFLLAFAGSTWAACDDDLPATGSRNDVLIIINDTAKDSCEVGRYYAEKRQLGRNNILRIKSPATPSVGYDQYEILRNQIIKTLQQKLLASGVQPVSCQVSSTYFCPEVISQIKANSTIRYLTFTKGVPARVVNNGSANWPSESNEAISTDGFIRRQLGDFLYPARIDGLDAESAKRLVDRAVEVEKSGWFGNLISAATKLDNGEGPGNSRFGKTDYHPITTTAVQSETLRAPFTNDPGGYFSEPILNYPLEGHHHWRYQFGLFNEADIDCTGNAATGSYYLNNSPNQSAGKSPEKCKVKLVKGNGANPAYNETLPGDSVGRVPTINNAIAYLGHLDNQPSLSGNFNRLLNWKKNSQCTAQLLCTDALCKVASSDVYKEIDTRCIGVAEGFIGHNFQSYPVSFFTSWPTGWRPLSRPTSATTGFGGEYGGGRGYTSYPLVRNDDGDGDSSSVWFGAHDKIAGTQCYQNDLNSLSACSDINNFEFGQVISPFSATPITTLKYYRVNLSYRSTSGDTTAPATLRATISVQDPNLTITNSDGTYPNNNQVPLRWMDSKNNYNITTSTNGIFRDSANNDAAIGSNSGGWKRVSAVFALDPGTLAGSSKQINGLSLILFSSNNFSGSVGIDSITLEEVDTSRSLVAQLPVTNYNLQDGHRQFATGDWAATFTSRLNAAAFWGSTTHNGGGTNIFPQLADSLASFIAGSPIAKAAWQNETGESNNTPRTGGLLYGDPLYSPISVNIRPNVGAASEATLNSGQLPIIIDAMNGSDSSKVSTTYRVDVCHASATNAFADFYVCDRESNSWVSTGISGSSGRNIQKVLDASQYAKTVHTLRIAITTTVLATGQSQTFQNFFTFFGTGRFLNETGNYDTDGDGASDETEVYGYQSDPTKSDTDGDGLTDGEEINVYKTSALKTDTDADGLSDGNEIHTYHTNPKNRDTDGDGLTDGEESLASNPTDPNKKDSDNDGYEDGWEVSDGTNPNNPTSYKRRQIPPILWRQMVD